MSFACAFRTDVGLGRNDNEDALLCLPDHGLWAVADGMGGHEAGEVASAMVVEALAKVAPTEGFAERLGRADAALNAVNDSLAAISRAQDQKRPMGSTVVALWIEGERYACMWVGDSRAYRVRDGAILQLSRDHSLVQDLVEAGMLEADQAEGHPNANVLTRAVGASTRFRVDVVEGEVAGGDRFVLASDGLTRLVTAEEIMATVTAHAPEAATEHLLQIALRRGAPDNVTLVVVAVD
ncbi:MAG TPA: protein phosphatase 2C domain-containing protein [Novosphingobium sp.]|nr:protein phosphatase 2C domain-containing protein [Novosphingobium sp.]